MGKELQPTSPVAELATVEEASGPILLAGETEDSRADTVALWQQIGIKAGFNTTAAILALVCPALAIPLALVASAGGDAIAAQIEPPSFRRLKREVKGLSRDLDRLSEQTGKSIDFESERFTSAVIQATQKALRTHLEAKLKAARNAVLNVAAGCNQPEEYDEWFLQLLDDMTPAHLSLLSMAANPQEWCKRRGVPLTNNWQMITEVKDAVRKEFKSGPLGEYLYNRLHTDLALWGMTQGDPIVPMENVYPNNGLHATAITPLGKAFYQFVMISPLPEEDSAEKPTVETVETPVHGGFDSFDGTLG